VQRSENREEKVQLRLETAKGIQDAVGSHMAKKGGENLH